MDCQCELSSENLKLMQLDWNLFVKCIVTGDETWIHHYDPESKPVFEKTCTTTQKNVKSHVFWILKKNV